MLCVHVSYHASLSLKKTNSFYKFGHRLCLDLCYNFFKKKRVEFKLHCPPILLISVFQCNFNFRKKMEIFIIILLQKGLYSGFHINIYEHFKNLFQCMHTSKNGFLASSQRRTHHRIFGFLQNTQIVLQNTHHITVYIFNLFG